MVGLSCPFLSLKYYALSSKLEVMQPYSWKLLFCWGDEICFVQGNLCVPHVEWVKAYAQKSFGVKALTGA